MLTIEEINEVKIAIYKAGELILHYQQNQDYQIEYKPGNDPVTTADMEANDLIIETLKRIFPNDVIVSEESYTPDSQNQIDELRKDAKRIWIIDPLDGTKDFIKGLPYYAVSVGFLLNGNPEFGFIYNPAKKFFLYGGLNYGIIYNDKKFILQTHSVNHIKDLKICISTSEIKQNLFPELLNAIPEDNLEFIGSVAYKLGLIAAGEVDLILSKRDKSDWDIAAGMAMLPYSEMAILDQNFNSLVLNKENIQTNGLIVGTKQAVELYKNFIHRL